MNTIEKLQRTLLWLADMRLKKPRWKKKHITRLRTMLELTRESIWDLEEHVSILELDLQDTRKALAALERKHKHEQTAVS